MRIMSWVFFLASKQEVSFFFSLTGARCVCVAARRSQETIAIVSLALLLAIFSDVEACGRRSPPPPPPPPPAPGAPPVPPPPPPINKVIRQREQMMTRNNCKQVQVRSGACGGRARGGRARGAVFVRFLTLPARVPVFLACLLRSLSLALHRFRRRTRRRS